uniref:Uncharacterized protein n=1 Tax=Panagrolaimus sp. PS1159 TaxID=55785 RepID=A0AC35FMJ4_9BILA
MCVYLCCVFLYYFLPTFYLKMARVLADFGKYQRFNFLFFLLNFLHFYLSTFFPRPLVPYKNFAVALYHGGLRKTRAPSFKNIKIC